MLLSVITVCYNSQDTIGKCIESVSRIGSGDVEYIIVDGDSTDLTCDIIKEWIPKLEAKNMSVKFISEKDSGIYNAMNKAISYATGEWCLFLNSDDYLFCNDFCDYLKKCKKDVGVLYGDVIVKTGENELYQKARPLSYLSCGWEMPFCHQSTFTRTELLKKYKYDEKYIIIADIDLYLRLYTDALAFDHMNKAISVFSNEGISQTHRIESIKEGKLMLKNHNLLTIQKYLILSVYECWYKLKKRMPTGLLTVIYRLKAFAKR